MSFFCNARTPRSRLLFGRSILNFLDFVNASDSGDPEAPYLQHYFRGGWAPSDRKPKRKVTEFGR